MHITKNKKISSFREVKNRSFLRFWPHSGRPKVMKIMTFSQHEKHENSMAGVVNLRLGGVQKSGKIESEKTKKTRKCRHPKNIKIARSWSFGRSKTGDGTGGNNSQSDALVEAKHHFAENHVFLLKNMISKKHEISSIYDL